jgi:hypothetical protein
MSADFVPIVTETRAVTAVANVAAAVIEVRPGLYSNIIVAAVATECRKNLSARLREKSASKPSRLSASK